MNINGTENADTLDGTNGDDKITALGGDDQINGGQGADRIEGAAGNDTINGGQGSDVVFGGIGDDRLTDNANGGDDRLSGGDGNDIIAVSRTGVAKDSIEIDGGAGADTITFVSDDGGRAKIAVLAGSGANNITVEEARDITITSGKDVDTISLDTANRGLVHSGGSADVITAASAQAQARTGISTGKGDDLVTLDLTNDAHFRLKLGEGSDTVTFAALATGVDSDPLVKIKDFAAGDTGDKLDLEAFLNSVLTGADGDAFASGHLRVIQDGSNAVLQIDTDGDGAAASFVDLVVFEGGTASAFTAFNFDGLDPTPEAEAAGNDFVV